MVIHHPEYAHRILDVGPGAILGMIFEFSSLGPIFGGLYSGFYGIECMCVSTMSNFYPKHECHLIICFKCLAEFHVCCSF